ncbi:cell division protein FtsQ/DivIB [Kocuria sp.]|uniref:cell division protein FtsQ/DivIB n=1 Tax=Kocuria sp. TaxID=1871328 RepID=UPI0026DD36BE|nr:FtsQ-type POTRA domain-containing protein [Kocuria sp.]MDO4919981.1 FtsQ-type POTRA domain-containing protein [Kocuria sp.]
MARSTPPHQPSADGEPREPRAVTPGTSDDRATVDDATSGDTASRTAASRGGAEATALPPRGTGSTAAAPEDAESAHPADPPVRVNDDAKVTRLDTGEFEAVPESGGRFSSWRARRRATRAAEAGPGAGEGDGDATTVVPFPPSPARRRRRTRLLAVLLSLLVLVVLVVAVFFSPLFATRTIDVQGATLTDPAKVREALSGYEGVPMTRISKEDVRASVGDVPQVKSVDVSFRPPHTISVQLHERVGVAVVEDGSSLVLVDSEGKPLSTVPRAQRPDVPVVSGGRAVLSTQTFQDVSAVLAALPADVLSRLDAAAAPSGSAVELTFKDGAKVRWGDASDSDVKAQVIAALVNSGQAAGATLIDVSAPLHPVVS